MFVAFKQLFICKQLIFGQVFVMIYAVLFISFGELLQPSLNHSSLENIKFKLSSNDVKQVVLF